MQTINPWDKSRRQGTASAAPSMPQKKSSLSYLVKLSLKGTASAEPSEPQKKSSLSSLVRLSLKGTASAVPIRAAEKTGFSRRDTPSWPGLTALLLSTLLAAPVFAQAGGGAGGAGGAGAAGTGATGPGAAAAAAGQGQATSAQSANGQTQPQNGQTPEQYASGVAFNVDPRKKSPAKPGALTLEQVVELAKTKNPTLLAAEANLRSVKAQELQAAVRANPYFTLYGTNITLPAEGASNPYAYSAQVSRLFERGNKREYRIEDAKATTAQTAAQLQDTIRQTILTVKTAFTTMLIAKQAALLSEANLKQFGHEVDIANDRYKAGDLAKIDFERLDLQLASFESGQANDIINLQQASAQLQNLIGYEQVKSDFDITGEVVPPVVNQTKDQLLQAAIANRPDYAAARFGVEAADAAYKLAKANGTTDPTLEAEYDRSGTYNSAGFSVNIPLRIFDKNQGNKETARFTADSSRFTEVAAKNKVYSDVEQAWVGYEQSKHLSERYSDHFLDESTDVLKIAQFAFEHGGIALIDYLDALRDARSTVSDALNAYQNTWIAIHQLSASAGTEVVP